MHRIKKTVLLLCFFLSLGMVMQVWASTRVNVVGLFHNKAIVMIGGSGPHKLAVGQTKAGVKLLSANSSSATFVIEGKRKVLSMGEAVSVGDRGVSMAPEVKSEVNSPVYLYADSRGHFLGNLSINGASLKYLVDTGATNVSMNSADAKFARIDYLKGEKSWAITANGLARIYLVTLNTLKIGTIVLHNVQASVHEGGSPSVVLLGMTAQNRLKVTREDSRMTLRKKY